MITTLHKTEPTAVDYLNDKNAITPFYARKLAKRYENSKKQEKRKFEQLSTLEQTKLRKHLTWIANSLEFISDNIDEINEILPNHITKGLFQDFQNVILPLNEMFIKNAMTTETEEMERITQQKEFEGFMRDVTRLSPKQFDLLAEYVKNLKYKS